MSQVAYKSQKKSNFKKHQANKELASVINKEISRFFNDDNYSTAQKYFTKEEIASLKKSSITKKKRAIILKLSNKLQMSESTFYHMLEGKNSRFDKVVNVLNFFDLELSYEIYCKSTLTKEILDKETKELMDKILLLDTTKKTLISNLVDSMK